MYSKVDVYEICDVFKHIYILCFKRKLLIWGLVVIKGEQRACFIPKISSTQHINNFSTKDFYPTLEDNMLLQMVPCNKMTI